MHLFLNIIVNGSAGSVCLFTAALQAAVILKLISSHASWKHIAADLPLCITVSARDASVVGTAGTATRNGGAAVRRRAIRWLAAELCSQPAAL